MFPIILIILVLGDLANTFTPEDTSFAVRRCMNMSSADNDLQMKWAYWKFPDKKDTHCFIKCVLEKLGLINLITRGLDMNKITDQIGDDNLGLVSDIDFWDIVAEDLSGTCKSYYVKWTGLIDQYPNLMRKIFFATDKEVEEYYRTNSYGAKQRGMTAIDFCVSTIQDINDSRYNTVREGEGAQCYWECVFNHFRYFDAYGRVDKNEVVASFRDYCRCSLEYELDIINSCVHQSNQNYPYGLCQMANTLYKCLVIQINYTPDVLTKRNLWTATF